MNKQKVLIFAPHPDDEVLGCAGTIAKYVKNSDDVYLCIVTKPYSPEWPAQIVKKKRKETENSIKELGIKNCYYLDFPTVRLDTLPRKQLNDSIFNLISKVKPSIVYIPHLGDLNEDHQIIHKSVLVASRPNGKSTIKKIISYETVSETEWGTIPFLPNLYTDITSFIKIKLDALKCYKSELRKNPHPRSAEIVEALAKKRGSESGLKYAEAFMIIREIV